MEQLGEGFGALIDDVWTTLRAAVADASGVEVEARADEFFAVFEAPRISGRRCRGNAHRVVEELAPRLRG